MTKKRYFKEDFYDECAIKKEDTIIAIVDSSSNARKICNELNALHEENVILKKIVEEDDILMKSLLSAYCNEKWEDFCKNYGVDFE